jgi:hypothetical protein
MIRGKPRILTIVILLEDFSENIEIEGSAMD